MPKNIFTVLEKEAKPKQRIIVSFPFDSNLSKNRAHGTTKNGKWYTKTEHRVLKENLLGLLKPECEKFVWKKDKYYLSIHVQKPSNRGDCVNYLDAIADVVKRAIGVDDNYMEVQAITFEVVRAGDQKIFISIAQ